MEKNLVPCRRSQPARGFKTLISSTQDPTFICYPTFSAQTSVQTSSALAAIRSDAYTMHQKLAESAFHSGT